MNQAPLPTKHVLSPGWAAFFGFTLYHADALGLVAAPFPVSVPKPVSNHDESKEGTNG